MCHNAGVAGEHRPGAGRRRPSHASGGGAGPVRPSESFIEEHLAQDVTLESGAGIFVSKAPSTNCSAKAGHQLLPVSHAEPSHRGEGRILEGEALGRICTDVGFADYSTFYRAFRREYGVAPSDFRDFNRL
ncbi:MAG: helix-turn-helix domain-containing protein [Ruthenibacterium lactatiformans]